MPEYAPYKILVEKSEKWMERPIKVSFVTQTPVGSNSSVVYLDDAECAELARLLTAHPNERES